MLLKESRTKTIWTTCDSDDEVMFEESIKNYCPSTDSLMRE